jgi:hypothetical protein
LFRTIVLSIRSDRLKLLPDLLSGWLDNTVSTAVTVASLTSILWVHIPLALLLVYAFQTPITRVCISRLTLRNSAVTSCHGQHARHLATSAIG